MLTNKNNLDHELAGKANQLYQSGLCDAAVDLLLAGIKQYYKPEDLVGKQIIVVVNLAPATLMGEKSDGMLLAADINGEPILLDVDKEVPPGTEIK